MSKKQIALVDLELKEMSRKGAIKRTQPAQGEFLRNLFLVGEKDGGYRPVTSRRMLNQFIPFLHFKMEGLSQLKGGGRLDVQTGHEVCILQWPIGSKLEEVCKISVEGDSIRVYVLVFWTRPSTKSVYKFIENSNLSPEKNQHQSDNVFGRYVDFESNNTRNSHELRQSYTSCRSWAF